MSVCAGVRGAVVTANRAQEAQGPGRPPHPVQDFPKALPSAQELGPPLLRHPHSPGTERACPTLEGTPPRAQC